MDGLDRRHKSSIRSLKVLRSCFHDAELVLSAIAKLLVYLLGEGEEWDERGGDNRGKEMRKGDGQEMGMPEKYLPGWASPGNWLGPEGHADLKNPVDDQSLCNLCSFPLKLFNDETEIMSSLNVFHLLTILSVKKYCLTSVILQKSKIFGIFGTPRMLTGRLEVRLKRTHRVLFKLCGRVEQSWGSSPVSQYNCNKGLYVSIHYSLITSKFCLDIKCNRFNKSMKHRLILVNILNGNGTVRFQ